MMETTDVVSVADAVELIDSNLKDLQGRELVSAAEVADLLLDLRMLLAAAQGGYKGANLSITFSGPLRMKMKKLHRHAVER